MGKGFTFSVELEAETEPHWVIETANDFISVASGSDDSSRELKVRLDKWLWAARFFKTRALARAAVENGKVLYDGQTAKPSMEIQVGATVQMRQGRFEKFVVIKGLSTRRKNSGGALELFEELPVQEVPNNGGLNYPMQSGNSHSYSNVPYNSYQHNNVNVNVAEVPKKTNRFLRRSLVRKDRDWNDY